MRATSARARRLLYRLGEDPYRDRLLLAWARAGDGIEAASWHELATLPQRWSAPKFPLKAADFISRGIAEGPALGHVLSLAEDAWVAAGFPDAPDALTTIADQVAARFAPQPEAKMPEPRTTPSGLMPFTRTPCSPSSTASSRTWCAWSALVAE